MCLAARAGKPEKAHIHLITLDEDVDLTMAQLRDTIWALHGEAITLDELGNQVERFLDRQTQYRDRPEVSVSFPPDAEDTLSPMQALHLVRIIQEGVNNALKHANASTLAVRVRHVSPDALDVVSRDDGDGLPQGPETLEDNYGLATLHERAAEIDGAAVFETSEANGTTIRVTIPTEDGVWGGGKRRCPGGKKTGRTKKEAPARP